jgi:hypothetical protein
LKEAKMIGERPVIAAALILCAAMIASSCASTGEKQPLMKKALVQLGKARSHAVGDGKIKHLRNARELLERAAHNKGGHRVAALKAINRSLALIKQARMPRANKLIDIAINQVRKGIAVGN